MMNTEKLRRFAEKYGMFPPGTRVLCAVSGGADSVCLLHLLRDWEGVETVAAHFNHHLRGEESDRDEAFVRALCRDLGVELRLGGADVAAWAEEKGLGTEEAARELRYAFLERTAEETGCNRIATAHNAGDNGETMLFNLARGTGLKGLCGIPPVRGKIVRPLLMTGREEIEAYLTGRGIPWVTDSTNLSGAYARNRIRSRVIPALQAENPAALANMAAAAESLREDEDYLSSLADAFIGEKLRDGSLPVRELAALPRPVLMRVLRRLCGPALSRVNAEDLYRLCLSPSPHAAVDVPGMRVSRDRDRLCFGAEEAAPIPRRELRRGETLAVPEAGLEISCEECGPGEEIHKTFNTFFFKNANICGRIFVASRSPGDRIRLAGRGCTKTLKKLFLEAGLPLGQRTQTPVFSDEAGVIAVAGFGVAQRCAPGPGDELLKIEIKSVNKEERVYG